MGDSTHSGSRREFLKEQENNSEIRKAWSVEQNITNDYPPTYIWNCENDNSVPPCNRGLMKSAMDAAGVKNAYEKIPGE